jgi:DNA-directed RNA polymerase specialized sigma24 family protein
MSGPTTSYLQGCLDRVRAGDPGATNDLLEHSNERLRILTRRMLSRFPNVHRWEQTDDVLQEVLCRIPKMLERIDVPSVRDYLRLAAGHKPWTLITMARHYYGANGIGANHQSPRPAAPGGRAGETPTNAVTEPFGAPLQLAGWTEFHGRVAELPEDECEIFGLLWYHGLTQDEAAEVLGISLSTVKRRWQAARLHLMETFGGEPPF